MLFIVYIEHRWSTNTAYEIRHNPANIANDEGWIYIYIYYMCLCTYYYLEV